VTSFALLTSSGLSNVTGILTGGTNGQVRSWQVGHSYKTPLSKPLLKMTVKEHANDVVKIQVTKDLTEAISAGKDGSCIIWDVSDIGNVMRKQILHATWSLVSALYHPATECQILTLAQDGQLAYWEVIDGKEIRHLTLGKHSTVTSLDLSPDGDTFCTTTNSSLIKVWKYKQGVLSKMGQAYSGPIVKAVYSPSGAHLTAITEHGAIIVWDF